MYCLICSSIEYFIELKLGGFTPIVWGLERVIGLVDKYVAAM